MKPTKRLLYMLVIGLSLIAQLIKPLAVRADDDTPPPPTDTPIVIEAPTDPVITETTPPPIDTSVATDVPTVEVATPTDPSNDPAITDTPTSVPATPTDTPPPERRKRTDTPNPVITKTPTPDSTITDAIDISIPPPTDQAPQITDTTATDSTITTVEQPTLLETLPDNTDLVVLDQNGEPLSLVTQQAADAIATSDPMWCPTGQNPTPGVNGCSGPFTSLSALVAGFVPTGNGIIWIQSGADAGSNVLIDGNGTWAAAKNYALTLQGGWSGIPNDISILSTNSIFDGHQIGILNWTGAVTINNLNITGAGNGIDLQTTLGNVTLTNITTENNTNGMNLWHVGNLTLNNVNASHNIGFYGLYIVANENVNMNNVIISNNQGAGALIYSSGINTVLTDVTASNNTNNGLVLYANPSGGTNATVEGGAFENNGNWGMYVNQCGAVNLSSSTIFSNNFSGDFYANCPVVVTTPSPAILTPVILTTQSHGEFKLNCAQQGIYEVHLPNDDTVWIYCPVSGEARIARLDNAFLPHNLPQGFTYASAFSLDIIQENGPIPLITEGGHIRADFVGTTLQPGRTYSILYWDDWILENGTWVEQPDQGMWIPLKDFLLDKNGHPHIFDLNPGDASDLGKKILSGVNVVTEKGIPRVEVSANFPGTFVLAQH